MMFEEADKIYKEKVPHIFEKTRNLLTDPEKWTQGVAARTKEKRACNYNDQNATCWCLVGGLWHSISQQKWEYGEDMIWIKVRSLADREAFKEGYHSCTALNDSVSHEEILSFLDECIDAGKKNLE